MKTLSYHMRRELWCSCPDAASWFALQQRHSRSAALGSALGYVLGIGDRHLDNLLLDYQTGDVFHSSFIQIILHIYLLPNLPQSIRPCFH